MVARIKKGDYLKDKDEDEEKDEDDCESVGVQHVPCLGSPAGNSNESLCGRIRVKSSPLPTGSHHHHLH